MPDWAIPENLQQLVDADEGGMWECTTWQPILLTVMSGTSYGGRDIPLAWQIEFDPDGELFIEPNTKIVALGLEPDGYGWATVIQSVFAQYYPDVVDDLHFGDTEDATCVVWVESEANCKLLMQVVWSLIHES